jgi:hypothetical protein
MLPRLSPCLIHNKVPAKKKPNVKPAPLTDSFTNISLLSANIQGLSAASKQKLIDLQILSVHNPDMTILNETHLSEAVKIFPYQSF